MLKQVSRMVVVSAVLLALASPAWAGNINVIFDPFPPGGGSNLYLLPSNGPWNVNWQSCSFPPVPSYSPAFGADACLAFANDTGGTINDFSITFVVPSALNGDTVSCSSPDNALAVNNCGSIGTLSTGQTLTLEFSGMPGIPLNYDFYIGETGANLSDLPPTMVQIPTHDPNTLVLLMAGMSMLAVAGIRRMA